VQRRSDENSLGGERKGGKNCPKGGRCSPPGVKGRKKATLFEEQRESFFIAGGGGEPN